MLRALTGFRIRAEEARAHAVIVALVGWTFAVCSGVVGDAAGRSVFGQTRWSDFLYFYTIGDIARTGPPDDLYNDTASHARQERLVPASGGDLYLGIYGPQTAILFAPLSRLPYTVAGAVWAGLTTIAYLWCVLSAWRPARDALDRRFVLLAALAFPPAWLLAAYGQSTAVPLVAFTAGWLAMERGKPFAAGLALGLLAVKPQLGLVLAAVAIATTQWTLIAGVAASIAAQALLVLTWFGAPVFAAYWRALLRLPSRYALFEPAAYKMHSIESLTELLPAGTGTLVWAATSAFVIAGVVLVWRSIADWRVRFGVLVLASVLVSPHVVVYDLSLLVLPALWIGGWMEQSGLAVNGFWQRTYWIAAATLLPTAALLKIQLSVVLMLELLVRVVMDATSYARTAAALGSSRGVVPRRPMSL